MSRWVGLMMFTLLAILAVVLGFGGISVGPGLGRTVIVAFLVVCVALFIWGVYFGRRPPPIPPAQ